MNKLLIISTLIMNSVFVKAISINVTHITQTKYTIEDKVKKMDELVDLYEDQKEKYRVLILKSEKEKKDLLAKTKFASSAESKKNES